MDPSLEFLDLGIGEPPGRFAALRATHRFDHAKEPADQRSIDIDLTTLGVEIEHRTVVHRPQFEDPAGLGVAHNVPLTGRAGDRAAELEAFALAFHRRKLGIEALQLIAKTHGFKVTLLPTLPGNARRPTGAVFTIS